MRISVAMRVSVLLVLAGAAACSDGDAETSGDVAMLEVHGATPKGQRIGPLTDDDRAHLVKQRTWVRDHYTEVAEERYGTVKGKLILIDTILKSGWVEPHETWKLQSLGITFGDALVQEHGLEWVVVDDEHGRSPALRVRGTSALVFPLTAISKRIERGETVEVQGLYEAFGASIAEMRDAETN